ncbi:MAG: metallophosphoesterase [Promethearchaeota archaeon]
MTTSTAIHSMNYLLDKLNSSGINISPKALFYLKDLGVNSSELEEIIQKLSFSPNFNSHITMETIQGDFVNVFKKFEAKTINSDQKSLENQKNLNSIKQKQKKHEKTKPSLEIVDPSGQMALFPVPKIDLEDDVVIESEDEIESISENSQIQEIQEETKKIVEKPSIIKKSIRSKKGVWEPLKLRRSTSTFKPIASDYNSEIKILKDPTKNLFTEGKIEEFLAVQKDKFEQLSRILKKRPEAGGLLEINMINRLNNSVNVKFIGMVVSKRQTAKKKYLIQFEDPTGTCMALIRQESKECYDLMQKLLPDHVVIVDGYLNVNQNTNSKIVLVNNIVFPDTPKEHQINAPNEDLSICLISDTHFGSKDWLEKVWYKFIDYINCRVGTDKQIKQAGKIKYLCITGDIVDGIGVYPNQDKRLLITDIYKQYEEAAKFLSEIPDYIKIIISPGDHDGVRKAIPAPAIPKDVAKGLYDLGAKMVGCPSLVSLHGIKTELYHGTSLIDINMMIPGLSNDDPVSSMKEMIRARHLAPTFGKKTEIAPVSRDWLVLDEVPDILHTGHLHKNGYGMYHGILLVNSGCFQEQTDFMRSLGLVPDYGKPTIVNIKDKLVPYVINLIGD